MPLTRGSSASPDERSLVAEIARASVLSEDEKLTVNALSGKIRRAEPALTKLDRTYDAQQRIQHIGLAIPPELRHVMTIINIPRIAVDEPVIRQDIRGFYRTGNSVEEDPALREAWEFNNLSSESTITHTDEKIFGGTYVSVGANGDDLDHPIIANEDPRELAVLKDGLGRKYLSALRMYRDEAEKVTKGTLYQPDSTVHMVRGQKGWSVTDRDDHNLGAVPIVGFVHRRRSRRNDGSGVSEMADVIGMTADIARLFSNMMVTSDALAVPGRWAAGVAKEDFVDKFGKPLPTWEAYITAMKATTNPEAKFGQFQAAQLANFYDTVDHVFAWCAAILGLPTRYAGQQTVNPAAEGAIRADEARLVGRVERMNRFDGDSWAWVMGLEERFRTGEWGQPNTIRVLWRDPATPTLSQIGDVATKMRIAGVLSTEGVWDMLGWDEPRKQQERDRLDAELENDPELATARALAGSGSAVTR